MEKQVELLAPAGNFQCFQAAINAGADAVYMGGDKFGARAYADNFSRDELLRAIDLGHLFHKKIYLTLNTLLKEDELLQVVDYVQPLYEKGLDGVIVQDFGVLSLLKEHFPGMELHASTQMTVTGKEGALLLKEYGVSRIVPARELSLEEIKDIKSHVDIEIETFIHGAMCYAYSGQCLFSSMLGGRSGNRGRCAGPCRLPYDACLGKQQLNRKNQQYLLSLKDLCAISLLPKLIDAGIDSFKIEGRMKSPEYVAGVTAIYRKYIDLYYANRKKEHYRFQVEKKDIKLLKKLYVRSDLESGYFEKHHGSSMITLTKPCYETGSKEELKEISDVFLKDTLTIPITGKVLLKTGQPAEIFLKTDEKEEGKSVLIKGNTVQQAANRPLDEAAVKKQMLKTGGTYFNFVSLEIILEGSCFLSVKELNDLRRQALDALGKKLSEPYERTYTKPLESLKKENSPDKRTPEKEAYHIVVSTSEQLAALVDFFKEQDNSKKEEALSIKKVSFSEDLFYQEGIISDALEFLKEKEVELSIAFPKVVRSNTLKELQSHIRNRKELSYISSFLVGNLELLHYLQRHFKDKELYGDYSLYSFNKKAYDFIRNQKVKEVCIPYEWSKHEIRAFLKANPGFLGECIVYSYIPLMESAGCILKTTGNCQKGKNDIYLIDRYKKRLPVKVHCDRCENTIYNSVPYSLHRELDSLKELGVFGFRMDFTIETKEQTLEILRFFSGKEKEKQPFHEFTKGHFGKGVE